MTECIWKLCNFQEQEPLFTTKTVKDVSLAVYQNFSVRTPHVCTYVFPYITLLPVSNMKMKQNLFLIMYTLLLIFFLLFLSILIKKHLKFKKKKKIYQQQHKSYNLFNFVYKTEQINKYHKNITFLHAYICTYMPTYCMY